MPPTIFAELDHDWATLVESATATTALRRWQRDEPALAPFSAMTELVAAAHRRGAPAECDRILVALARRAGSDGLAARTLLQLLLPGAKALARRLWWLGGPDERAAGRASRPIPCAGAASAPSVAWPWRSPAGPPSNTGRTVALPPPARSRQEQGVLCGGPRPTSSTWHGSRPP
jgi:hypothetical protein